MAKINVAADCGNAPKKIFLRDFIIAFANKDTASMLNQVADNIQWNMVGERSLQGKNDVEKALENIINGQVSEATLVNVITHGNEGAVNGTMTLVDGKTYGFCQIFVFTSHSKDAKLKHITSYWIKDK